MIWAHEARSTVGSRADVTAGERRAAVTAAVREGDHLVAEPRDHDRLTEHGAADRSRVESVALGTTNASIFSAR
ncbi:MAG: hypothetical protein AAGF02_18440 [Actinomycetota bacterium]